MAMVMKNQTRFSATAFVGGDAHQLGKVVLNSGGPIALERGSRASLCPRERASVRCLGTVLRFGAVPVATWKLTGLYPTENCSSSSAWTEEELFFSLKR